MSYAIKIVYAFLFPPGIYVMALMVFAGMMFRWKKYRLASLLLACFFLFYMSSCNITGYWLLGPIENQYAFPARISGDCIVVLGEGASLETPAVDGPGELSGDTALNVIAALKLYDRLHVPILLSGGIGLSGNGAGNEAQLSKRDLIAMKVPENMILVEDQSRTTLENAENSAKILRERGYSHPILVTTSPHMPRSVELFRQEGFDVLPLPTRYFPQQKITYNVFDFLPSVTGTMMVQQGLKESLGKLQAYIM
jgi:uncharacterized SAM-binding protein YcdF (DUF218 family)